MNLHKELLDFLEANNWLSLENEENAKGVIASYIKVYRPELHNMNKFLKIIDAMPNWVWIVLGFGSAMLFIELWAG